jgi:hypothetical protein
MIVAGPQERQLADAAQALLDLCREINKSDPAYDRADPETLLAGAISLAVQAVWMCEDMTGPRGASDIKAIDAEMALAKYRGLGLGAGNVIAAMTSLPGREIAHGVVLGAIDRARQKRERANAGEQETADLMRRLFRDRP